MIAPGPGHKFSLTFISSRTPCNCTPRRLRQGRRQGNVEQVSRDLRPRHREQIFLRHPSRIVPVKASVRVRGVHYGLERRRFSGVAHHLTCRFLNAVKDNVRIESPRLQQDYLVTPRRSRSAKFPEGRIPWRRSQRIWKRRAYKYLRQELRNARRGRSRFYAQRDDRVFLCGAKVEKHISRC